MQIADHPEIAAKVDVVLRCEPDGQILMAICRRTPHETG
jgi:hypothetical protein